MSDKCSRRNLLWLDTVNARDHFEPNNDALNEAMTGKGRAKVYGRCAMAICLVSDESDFPYMDNHLGPSSDRYYESEWTFYERVVAVYFRRLVALVQVDGSYSFMTPDSLVAGCLSAAPRPPPILASATEITSKQEFEVKVPSSSDLVFINFFSERWEARNGVVPLMNTISETQPGITFCRVDGGKVPDLAAELGVSATLIFMSSKCGEKANRSAK
ncbi:hypothetical protein BDW68DRAFT_178596 [Aspergillus falconensis]